MQSEYMIARYKEVKKRIGDNQARTDDVLFLMTALDKANTFIEMYKTISEGRDEDCKMLRAELVLSRKDLEFYRAKHLKNKEAIRTIKGVKGFGRSGKILKAAKEMEV